MITPTRLPAREGDNVWDYPLAGHPMTLRCVLLHRPDAHPVWPSYVVSLVHLRDVPEQSKPPHREYSDSTHEILCFALDPDVKPDPLDSGSIRVLTPSNLTYQLRALSDALALSVFSQFVGALSRRELSPDSDFRSQQRVLLRRLWRQAREAN